MSCNWSVDLCSPRDFMGKIRVITAYLLGQGRSTLVVWGGGYNINCVLVRVWNKPWNSKPKRYCRLTTPEVIRVTRTYNNLGLHHYLSGVCNSQQYCNLLHFLLRTLTTEICLFCRWQLELVNKFHNRSSEFTTSVCCWSDGILCSVLYMNTFRYTSYKHCMYLHHSQHSSL